MASAVGLSLAQCSLCYLLPSIKLYIALQGSGSWPPELAHALASSCRSALQSTPLLVVHRQEPRRHPKLTGDHPDDILYSSTSTLAASA